MWRHVVKLAEEPGKCNVSLIVKSRITEDQHTVLFLKMSANVEGIYCSATNPLNRTLDLGKRSRLDGIAPIYTFDFGGESGVKLDDF